MNEEWLVDGYNLLHRVRARAPKISRESLCDFLASFASAEKIKLTAFFDGAGNDSEFDSFRTEFFSARYSQKVSADAAIERTLFEHRAKCRMLVVTDDRAIRDIAHGSGARVLGLEQFLERARESGKETREVLDRESMRSRGFHRPFDEKLGPVRG